MQESGPVTTTVQAGVAVLRLHSAPVDAPLRAALLQALRAAVAAPGVRGIVLAAEGQSFSAEADTDAFDQPPAWPEVVAALAACPKPLVAALQGMVSGGGLALALACHARVAADIARLGLTALELRLVPGAGSTQRLPRLVGAAPALALLVEGAPLGAAAALRLGLLDEMVAGDPVPAASRRALAPPPAREDRLGPREAFEAAAAALRARATEDPALAACIACLRTAFEQPMDAALAFERAQFQALLHDERARALRHACFAERAVARIPDLPPATVARPVRRVAVIGAGTMGCGIAVAFANAGLPVTLIETTAKALAQGQARVAATYAGAVRRGSLTPEARDARLAHITGAVGLQAAAGADVVVEAVFEELALKQEILGRLCAIASPDALLATNTSYLDVDAIARATARPGDVLGLHFFSPAPVMRLLEVVRGAATTPQALATAVALARRLGKVPVVVGVCHGFVGNRMLARRGAQAERLLLEGAAPAAVDAALVAFGFKMGPFAMADMAGLDIGWRVRRATGKVAPVADALCEAGRLGQKTARGYYDYAEGARQGTASPEVARLIGAAAAAQGIARRDIGGQEIAERLILPMIDEGARILEEGIATRAGDIDVVWLHGYNWPAWRGGPMYHAAQLGLPQVVAALRAHAARAGDDTLLPSAALQRYATAGQGWPA